ncbi:ATP-dependent nuclease [Botrimarina mediterranea]|uniref:ATP-dependent nuclease n=1 Tax=Botrimarina mediterranea TaxID=2528022 RepID=UPI00118992EA|nr:DNA replication and repair protein RecF [Planctomycetes bacterium K2D]
MHISQLTIRGFRNFSEDGFEIALKPFTLILGENNIGKTNIVAAASLIFGQEISTSQSRRLGIGDLNYPAVQRFKQQVAAGDLPPDKVRFPEVFVEAKLTGMNEDQHAVVGDWYVDEKLEVASVTYRYALRGNFNATKWVEEQRDALDEHLKGGAAKETLKDYVGLPIGDYRHMLYGGGVQANECEANLLRMLRGECLDALRDANRELVAGGEQRLLYRVLSSLGEAEYADVKESLAQLSAAVDTNVALSGLRKRVADLLGRVSLLTEGSNNDIAFRFSAPDSSELLKKVGMLYGADPVSVDRNGLGRNNLLYLALVVSQIARTDDPGDGQENYACFRLVSVEEPEAHLHPHLQDHLAGNIESVRKEHDESLQLLLTSHSTHLAARLDLKNTVVVFRDEGGKLASRYVLQDIDPETEADAVRFLSLYLDATKSRLLFARSVILVEGIAEQTLVPLLFERTYGEKLERHGCSVVNVNGVAFKHFLTVFRRGLFRRCVVLTDSDAGARTENRAYKLVEEFGGSDSIDIKVSETSTFEKDLVQANREGPARELLLDALVAARQRKGKGYAEAIGDGPHDPDKFYEALGPEKAAFAFGVATALRERPDIEFATPPYIQQGFERLAGEPSQRPSGAAP